MVVPIWVGAFSTPSLNNVKYPEPVKLNAVDVITICSRGDVTTPSPSKLTVVVDALNLTVRAAAGAIFFEKFCVFVNIDDVYKWPGPSEYG